MFVFWMAPLRWGGQVLHFQIHPEPTGERIEAFPFALLSSIKKMILRVTISNVFSS